MIRRRGGAMKEKSRRGGASDNLTRSPINVESGILCLVATI